MPFYNEHAKEQRVQRRTSRDCRNEAEYIVKKKLHKQQIHLKSLPHWLIFVLSSIVIASTEASHLPFLLAARSLLQVHCTAFFRLQFIFATFYARVLLLHVHCRKALKVWFSYWLIPGVNTATSPILHGARSLATHELFHTKEQQLLYRNQCKTQNFSTFLHFAVFWQIYFSNLWHGLTVASHILIL